MSLLGIKVHVEFRLSFLYQLGLLEDRLVQIYKVCVVFSRVIRENYHDIPLQCTHTCISIHSAGQQVTVVSPVGVPCI